MASQEHSIRIRIATEHRKRNPDPDLITDLRRQHAAVRIEDYVRRILAGAPPLHDDQRQKLAALVLGDADAAA